MRLTPHVFRSATSVQSGTPLEDDCGFVHLWISWLSDECQIMSDECILRHERMCVLACLLTCETEGAGGVWPLASFHPRIPPVSPASVQTGTTFSMIDTILTCVAVDSAFGL